MGGIQKAVADAVGTNDCGAEADDEDEDDQPRDLSEVIVSCGSVLLARAIWLTKSEDDAADLLQDTLERALRADSKRRNRTLTTRWLLTIMHNRFLDDRRARAVRRSVPDAQALLERMASEPVPYPALWRVTDSEPLAACVARLSPGAQEIFKLRADGVSYVDLASRFGIAIGTVGTRLARVRARLRAMLCAELGLSDQSTD